MSSRPNSFVCAALRRWFITLFVVGALLAAAAPAASPTTRPPNVVLLLADDLGYGDVGCNGGTAIRTPAIDRLAAEGQRWTSFYAAGCVCVPSRMGLMTGKYPLRLHGEKRIPPILPGDEVTLPEMLKSVGYRTALVGKWHLGMEHGSHPLDQGFDEFYGTPSSNDHFPRAGRLHTYENYRDATSADYAVPLIRRREIVERPVEQSTLTRRYTSEAVRWIRENRTTPFFLYLAYNMPHVPLFASPDFAGRSARGKYGDAVEELDWSVGEVMRALEEAGLARDTVLMFSSDNGPWTLFRDLGGTAAPYRNGKGTGWEGAFRVPFLVRWHGRIAPGVTADLGTGLDLYATLAALTGNKPVAGAATDSLDLSPVWLGRGRSPRREWFYQHESGEVWAVRRDNFKAHFRSTAAHRAPSTPHSPPQLYDLAADPAETRDVAVENPAIGADLAARLAEFRREMAADRAAVPAELRTPNYRLTHLQGIGYDPAIDRQDPSNVIKVDDLFHVWFTQRPADVHPYASTVYHATSRDGVRWDVQGEAVGKGAAGEWDSFGAITPYVAVWSGKYYLYYTGTSGDRAWDNATTLRHIGIAVADSPAGPWRKFSGNPVLSPGAAGAWDSLVVDDAHLIRREGRWWMYYKGRTARETGAQTKWGLAWADSPTGPFVKRGTQPIFPSGHTVCVWPHRGGVAALVDHAGPERYTVQWSANGIDFVRAAQVPVVHTGCGPFDPDAFKDTGFGYGVSWGVAQLNVEKRLCIVRFDLDCLVPGTTGR